MVGFQSKNYRLGLYKREIKQSIYFRKEHKDLEHNW